MRAGIDRLRKRTEQLEAFDPNSVPERGHHSVSVIETAIEETLARVFGKGTQEYGRYLSAARLDHGPMIIGEYHEAPFRRYLTDGKAAAIAKLQQAITGLEEEIEHQSTTSPETNATKPVEKAALKRSVFIVHGRDGHPREAVARFLERIGFQVVVLHEQPNGGQTVIEKFEKHGDVGFAVVLLTPDDVGGLKGEELQRPRARQNVILELGYFIGKLGRSRVVALKSGDIELPSDFVGVAYEEFDAGGGWQKRLAGELQNASYDIDWNIVMRPSTG
jgi:predicted nucleotide-binding protein